MDNSLSLLTDFYELTMMQGYFLSGHTDRCVFEMFFRYQPFRGGYSVFAGLGPLLEELENLEFSDEDIRYLESLGTFKSGFLDRLKDFTFTGDIYSVDEGSVVFPNEPLIRVHGTLIEAQLIESMLLNFINFQTLIATKTARIVHASGGMPVLEFGLRRAQGIDGSLSGSRAAFIGGAAATSNTLAGKKYGIPVNGTMAHSWVMSFDSELQSFESYSGIYGKRCVLLVDSFDTLKSGIPNAVTIFDRLKKTNPELMAIRIDSGDLEYLSKEARKIFDRRGLKQVKIFVSGDMDEWIIRQLRESGAPIDAWGVGTRLITGGSDPALPGVYKIVARGKGDILEPCIKISNQSEKITNPGIKNIMRFHGEGDKIIGDLIYLQSGEEMLLDRISKSEPIRFTHPSTNYAGFTLRDYTRSRVMLKQVMKNGKRTGRGPLLKDIQELCDGETSSLDETYKRLLNPHVYRVSLSEDLKELKTGLITDIQSEYGISD